jgi:hypothetical protein
MERHQLLAWLDSEFDRMSHTLIVDYPKGDFFDGYEAALEAVYKLLEGE